MTYETLDSIADAYIPLLGLCSLLSLLLDFRPPAASFRIVSIRFSLLMLLVGLVYTLMILDDRLSIWHTLGGLDYSTHTALSLVLTLFLEAGHKQHRGVLVGLFAAYLLLMLYQHYHTVADIVSTGMVMGLIAVPLWVVLGKNRKRAPET